MSPALRWRLALAGLVAIGALQLLPALDAAPIMRAEIYFMDGARAMVERGDYLVPYHEGEPFFDKPPLMYWLIALAFRALGPGAGAARLVSAGTALATVLATVWLGAQLVGRRAGLAGGLILVTTFAFTSFGRLAMSDMLLALFSTTALALAVGAVAGGWRRAALGAVLGLGFLTKGPIALLLPGLGILALAWQRRRLLAPPGRWALAGLAAFAVCGLGWFALVWLRLGAEPLEYFFLSENLERFAGRKYDAGQPGWFYLPTYLAEGAPWSLLLPLALRRAWRTRGDAAGAGRTLLLGWLALMLVPLTLSRGKLDYYLLPLYPAFSLLIGELFAGEPWQHAERRWAAGVLAATAGVALLAPLVPGRLPEAWLPAAPVRAAVTAAALAAAVALIAVARRPSPGRALGALAATAAGGFWAGSALFVPAFRAAQPEAAIVADVARERRARPDARLAFCEDPLLVARDLLFEVRLAAQERCDLWNPASSDYPFLLLLDETRRDDLMEIEAVRFVGRYRYLPATALTLEGLLEPREPAELALLANYPTDDPELKRRNRRDRKRAVRERQAGRS